MLLASESAYWPPPSTQHQTRDLVIPALAGAGGIAVAILIGAAVGLWPALSAVRGTDWPGTRLLVLGARASVARGDVRATCGREPDRPRFAVARSSGWAAI